jgi:hypothetical protein
MSRLTHALDQGTGAARVSCGLWHAVVWYDPDADPARGGWHCHVYQPQVMEEDLVPVEQRSAPTLDDLEAALMRYPYFITPDMPWAPALAPVVAGERTGT